MRIVAAVYDEYENDNVDKDDVRDDHEHHVHEYLRRRENR